jgi:hypothetical protein
MEGRPESRAVTAARPSGIAADGTWAPAFPGQRQPFTEGNTAGMHSGVRSQRTWKPLAERILAGMLANPQPPWLAQPLMRPYVTELAELRAKRQLLEDYLFEIGLWPDSDADLNRRRSGAWRAWERCETREFTLLRKLGGPGQCDDPPTAPWRRAAAECGWTFGYRVRGRLYPVALPSGGGGIRDRPEFRQG